MLNWLSKNHEVKNHSLHGDWYWSKKAPSTIYEKRPLKDPEGKVIDHLYVSWIILNNPNQLNSYTTDMVKGVIAAFENASLDRDVVAVVFTGIGSYS